MTLTNLSNLVFMLATVGLVGLVYHNVETIKGWSFEQLLVIYAAASVSRALWHLLSVNLISIGVYVQTGDFDRLLLRPINPLFQLVADYVDNDDWGELVLGIALLVYAWKQANLPFSLSTIGWLCLMLVCGFVFYFSIHLFFNTFAFWVVQNKPLERMAWELDRFTTYPMTIYGPWLRFILTWLIPFGFVAFYPATVLFSEVPSKIGKLTPLIALGAFLSAYRFWIFGLSKYQSTGS
ncbi:MAG: ABC-2 family transporter protein [Candidatus Methanomethyliaceae archaeon]